jgi:hypothetical protein
VAAVRPPLRSTSAMGTGAAETRATAGITIATPRSWNPVGRSPNASPTSTGIDTEITPVIGATTLILPRARPR